MTLRKNSYSTKNLNCVNYYELLQPEVKLHHSSCISQTKNGIKKTKVRGFVYHLWDSPTVFGKNAIFICRDLAIERQTIDGRSEFSTDIPTGKSN